MYTYHKMATSKSRPVKIDYSWTGFLIPFTKEQVLANRQTGEQESRQRVS